MIRSIFEIAGVASLLFGMISMDSENIFIPLFLGTLGILLIVLGNEVKESKKNKYHVNMYDLKENKINKI